MTLGINSQQAKQNRRSDLDIFNEITSIMRQIIIDSNNGLAQTVIENDTTMTNSTPTVQVVGTASNPIIAGNETLILAGSTITLGSTGSNLNSIIADINDAGITGVLASKNSDNNLVITYTCPASDQWLLTIGAGTANALLGFTDNSTHTATDPDSVTYHRVWRGVVTDRSLYDSMQEVINHFDGLGFDIERRTNPNTTNTFKWIINY